jgi:chromosome segregation ATPase
MKKEELIGLGLDEETAKKVADASTEELKGYVPKSRLNEVIAERDNYKGELADRDKQLEDLKKSSGDSEALKNQIAEMQKTNKEALAAKDAEILSIRKNNAVEKALSGAQAKNAKAVMALLDLENAELQEDGTIKGLEEQIKSLKESEETSFLFNVENKPPQPTVKGATPGQAGTPPTASNEWETKLAEARKNGDNLAAIAIKREAAENGINLL